MRHILTLFLIIHFGCLYSQDYTLEAFQSTYQEISNYNSYQLDTDGDTSIEGEFDLDFEFPFFTYKFDRILLSGPGIIDFDDEDISDFPIRLFTFGYSLDPATNPNNIPSDIRYKDTLINGTKAFIIQWTRVRFNSDPSINTHDSHLNFQYWLFEDGTIELHTGPYNLDNSPVYKPGDGFWFYPSNTSPKQFAFQVALYHPYDENIKLYYGANEGHKEYVWSEKDTSLVWMPPEGWVIRMKNQTVNTQESNDLSQILKVYPNPTSSMLNIVSTEPINDIIITDINGKVLIKYFESGPIDISALNAGIYFCRVKTNNKIKTLKFIKTN